MQLSLKFDKTSPCLARSTLFCHSPALLLGASTFDFAVVTDRGASALALMHAVELLIPLFVFNLKIKTKQLLTYV